MLAVHACSVLEIFGPTVGAGMVAAPTGTTACKMVCAGCLVCDAENSAHLYIVVDTNILLSYVTFLERMLELPSTNEMANLLYSEGLPGFTLVFVVPYIVMVELDNFKSNKKGTH